MKTSNVDNAMRWRSFWRLIVPEERSLCSNEARKEVAQKGRWLFPLAPPLCSHGNAPND